LNYLVASGAGKPGQRTIIGKTRALLVLYLGRRLYTVELGAIHSAAFTYVPVDVQNFNSHFGSYDGWWVQLVYKRNLVYQTVVEGILMQGTLVLKLLNRRLCQSLAAPASGAYLVDYRELCFVLLHLIPLFLWLILYHLPVCEAIPGLLASQ
jgi:hypothetical protein